jgi:hypothetical protein
MVVSMRRRLEKFLPIVLLALVVQILAPIAACWATGVVASDPLSTAIICHTDGPSDTGTPTDQGGAHVHDSLCCLACASHAAPSFDAPPQFLAVAPYRLSKRVVWHKLAPGLLGTRPGSLAQARAPPSMS